MCSTRVAAAAMSGACVASSSVTPSSRFRSPSSDSTAAPLAESRLPVGSSATTSSGVVDQGARDRAALQFSAGQLMRIVRQTVAESDASRERGGPFQRGCRRAAVEQQRQRDVLGERQRRQQVEELEDEADARASQQGQSGV